MDTAEHLDAPARRGRLRRSTATLLARCVIDPTLDASTLPPALLEDGRPSSAARALGATLAAPLLHVTIDRHLDGEHGRAEVRWAPTGSVAVGAVADVDGDPLWEVVVDAPEAFPVQVVGALQVHDRPAAPGGDRYVDPRRLAAAVAGNATGPVADSPAELTVLATAVLVAPAETSTLDLAQPPAPQPGTEPVSRALVDGADGCWRVAGDDGAGGPGRPGTLQLTPWSGLDEQRWFREVLDAYVATLRPAGDR